MLKKSLIHGVEHFLMSGDFVLVTNFSHCKNYGDGQRAAEYINGAFNGQKVNKIILGAESGSVSWFSFDIFSDPKEVYIVALLQDFKAFYRVSKELCM